MMAKQTSMSAIAAKPCCSVWVSFGKNKSVKSVQLTSLYHTDGAKDISKYWTV